MRFRRRNNVTPEAVNAHAIGTHAEAALTALLEEGDADAVKKHLLHIHAYAKAIENGQPENAYAELANIMYGSRW